jgi:hypothetical protein
MEIKHLEIKIEVMSRTDGRYSLSAEIHQSMSDGNQRGCTLTGIADTLEEVQTDFVEQVAKESRTLCADLSDRPKS